MARAHPRAYGENRLTWILERLISGSSPRIRGKRLTGLGDNLG